MTVHNERAVRWLFLHQSGQTRGAAEEYMKENYLGRARLEVTHIRYFQDLGDALQHGVSRVFIGNEVLSTHASGVHRLDSQVDDILMGDIRRSNWNGAIDYFRLTYRVLNIPVGGRRLWFSVPYINLIPQSTAING